MNKEYLKQEILFLECDIEDLENQLEKKENTMEKESREIIINSIKELSENLGEWDDVEKAIKEIASFVFVTTEILEQDDHGGCELETIYNSKEYDIYVSHVYKTHPIHEDSNISLKIVTPVFEQTTVFYKKGEK